jgi:hypothetical protein
VEKGRSSRATKIRILFFYPSTDTRDNEEGFRIYRISVKDTTKIAEALAGASYAVSAYNSAGESSPSKYGLSAGLTSVVIGIS